MLRLRILHQFSRVVLPVLVLLAFAVPLTYAQEAPLNSLVASEGAVLPPVCWASAYK